MARLVGQDAVSSIVERLWYRVWVARRRRSHAKAPRRKGRGRRLRSGASPGPAVGRRGTIREFADTSTPVSTTCLYSRVRGYEHAREHHVLVFASSRIANPA